MNEDTSSGSAQSQSKDKGPLKSSLWTTMMETYEKILSNTSDKEGWEWLKAYVLPSLIWFLPHPVNKDNDDNVYVYSYELMCLRILCI